MAGEALVDAVADQGKKAVEAGKGWFMSLLSSPLDLFKGGLFGTLKGLMGAGKGLFMNTIGNPVGVATTGGILWLLTKFAPDAVKFVSDAIGPVGKDGKTLALRFVEDEKKGVGSVIMDMGLAAAAIQGAVGVGSGLIASTADSSEGSDKSFMEKAGGLAGSTAVIATLGYLIYESVHSTQVGALKTPGNVSATPSIPQKPSAAKPVIQPH